MTHIYPAADRNCNSISFQLKLLFTTEPAVAWRSTRESSDPPRHHGNRDLNPKLTLLELFHSVNVHGEPRYLRLFQGLYSELLYKSPDDLIYFVIRDSSPVDGA